ncbi:DNA polymerase [Paenibacillus larvae]|uniref:DNA polymerase n=1 Tax=Paenibacillus larvae TaxID=1464 RepID=UPI002281A7F2|nr:DNA polymerase [Paenibacillus larvae]MCY9512342.1 DNA polymerase [Paenibacillus larvae]MCY9524871.1 DNA polymerase [Paenibacillus larvae]
MVTDENYHDIVRKLITITEKVPKGTNLQNLPAKGAGVRVRNCFIPRKGFTFVGADLGQIEPRIMAHIMYTKYGDNSMRQIFVDGVDLYTTGAVQTFGLEEKYCLDEAYDPTGTFEPRKLMKTGQLAVSYDQSPKSFAKKMNVTEEVAHMFFENFDRTYPSFRTMVKDIREEMKRCGYVETLFGRKRRFPDFNEVASQTARNEQKLIRLYTERKRLRNKKNPTAADMRRLTAVQDEIDILSEKRGLVGYWLRAAFNAVIQGTGADILKLIGIRNAEICRERGWEMNASIHDEIKNSIPNDQLTEGTIDLINEIMTQTVELSVPLITDTVIEPCWMQTYKPDEWDFGNCRPIIEKYDEKGRVFDDYDERLLAAKGDA